MIIGVAIVGLAVAFYFIQYKDYESKSDVIERLHQLKLEAWEDLMKNEAERLEREATREREDRECSWPRCTFVINTYKGDAPQFCPNCWIRFYAFQKKLLTCHKIVKKSYWDDYRLDQIIKDHISKDNFDMQLMVDEYGENK